MQSVSVTSGTTREGRPAGAPRAAWRDGEWVHSSAGKAPSLAPHPWTESCFIMNSSGSGPGSGQWRHWFLGTCYWNTCLKCISRARFVSKHLHEYTWGFGVLIDLIVVNNSSLGWADGEDPVFSWAPPQGWQPWPFPGSLCWRVHSNQPCYPSALQRNRSNVSHADNTFFSPERTGEIFSDVETTRL